MLTSVLTLLLLAGFVCFLGDLVSAAGGVVSAAGGGAGAGGAGAVSACGDSTAAVSAGSLASVFVFFPSFFESLDRLLDIDAGRL